MRKNTIYSIMIVVVLLICIITFIEFNQTEAKDRVVVGSEDTEETNTTSQPIVDEVDEPANSSVERQEDNTPTPTTPTTTPNPTPTPDIIIPDTDRNSEGSDDIDQVVSPQLSEKPSPTPTLSPTPGKPKPEEVKLDQALINEKRQAIEAIYTEIDAILKKSSKGSGNVMAQLFGFSDELEAIAQEADVAMQKEAEALERIQECDDRKKLDAYEQEASDYLDDFTNQKEKILTAKQNQDIDQLNVELESMLKLIKEYVEYIQEVT